MDFERIIAERYSVRNFRPEHLPKDVIIGAIEKLGKGASVRGEALSLEEFAALSNIISEML